MSQQKDNSGTLWENTKKTKQTQPDITGNVTIAGVDYRVSGWVKQGVKQETQFEYWYWSLAFTKKSKKSKDALEGYGGLSPEPPL